jgi:outer membrane biosynthesis protein TonB
MARAYNESSSLRFGRREIERLVVALLCSLLAHLGAWGGYQEGKKLGWWREVHPPKWIQQAVQQHLLQPLPVAIPEPTTFVDVSHADADAPKLTKYYSNKNSRAANPDVGTANIPEIRGTQPDAPKTENVPKVLKAQESLPPPKPQPALPLQPTMPPPQLAQTEPTEEQKPGDLDQLRPKKEAPAPAPTPAPPERPRTLKQAQAQSDQLPGPAMHQVGGVARHALWSSLDAKAVPFGDYDRAIIEAVQQRWYDMLDSRRFADDRTGKVILRFKMKPDGSIIEMQPLENTVGELLGYLCQEAIEEAAPFAPWPTDMQSMIGTNYREITFTFYYY